MKNVLVFVSICFMSLVNAQKSNETLLTIGDRDVSKAEFEYFFKKNKKDNKVTKEELDDYLELYKKFILKVYEAEQLQRDTLPKFLNEFGYYQNQLAKPYLTSTEVTDALIDEALERRKTEVRASHILIKVDENAAPQDTLQAYKKILEAQKELEKGTAFEEVVKKYSQGSTVDRGGDLGYFSVLSMVYSFENQAYKTEVGAVSGVFRTRFGYHILKVTDKRPARGEIKVAHIMILDREAKSAETPQRKKIEEIYQKLLEGEDFDRLALLYSDDSRTNGKGGVLDWFSSGKMIPEFEDAAYGLKENGAISEPVKTAYGWHVIKRIDYKGLEEDEVLRKQLEGKIKKDIERSELSESVFYNQLKSAYAYRFYEKSFLALEKIMDSTLYSENWKSPEADKWNKKLFSFGGKTFTQADFINYLKGVKRVKKADVKLSADLRSWMEDFVRASLLDFEKTKLEEKYPKYKFLLQEYHDGMLLFDLVQDMVWKKAEEDSVGLDQYYQNHIADFQWGNRYFVTSYRFNDEANAQKAKEMLTAEVSDSALLAHFNQKSTLVLTLEEKVFEQGRDDSYDKISSNSDLTGPIAMNDQFYVFKKQEFKAAGPKEKSECRGILISKYQSLLEEEWIKGLQEKYEIQVDEKVLYSLINE